MKNPRMNRHQQSLHRCTVHNPVLPALPEKVRRLLNATYAAHGGAERMSLDEWRAIEQELKRKLENDWTFSGAFQSWHEV
jgi:hypothetical protein